MRNFTLDFAKCHKCKNPTEASMKLCFTIFPFWLNNTTWPFAHPCCFLSCVSCLATPEPKLRTQLGKWNYVAVLWKSSITKLYSLSSYPQTSPVSNEVNHDWTGRTAGRTLLILIYNITKSISVYICPGTPWFLKMLDETKPHPTGEGYRLLILEKFI